MLCGESRKIFEIDKEGVPVIRGEVIFGQKVSAENTLRNCSDCELEIESSVADSNFTEGASVARDKGAVRRLQVDADRSPLEVLGSRK